MLALSAAQQVAFGVGAGVVLVAVGAKLAPKVIDEVKRMLNGSIEPRGAGASTLQPIHRKVLTKSDVISPMAKYVNKKDVRGVLIYLSDENNLSAELGEKFDAVKSLIRGLALKQDALVLCVLEKERVLKTQILTFDEVDAELNEFLVEHSFFKKHYMVFGT